MIYKIISLFIFLLLINNSYSTNQTIIQIEEKFKNGSLSANHNILNIENNDNNEKKAAKNYYKALLDKDIRNSLINHNSNFQNYENQFYGQLSGLQLVIIDFINREYDKALTKLTKINSALIPDAVYWNAKILQTIHRYNEAINMAYSFIKKNPSDLKIAYYWLIVLESTYYTKNLSSYEKYLSEFSKNSTFSEYKAYLLIYNAILYETSVSPPDLQKAANIYQEIIKDFPESRFRVQAEDRLYALRNNTTSPPISSSPNVIPSPIGVILPLYKNKPVSRFEDLDSKAFYLQFGVFSTRSAANNFLNTLNKNNISTFVITKPVSGKTMFAVIQGPFLERAKAIEYQNSYKQSDKNSFMFFVD